jgi:hypothetical protein
VDEVSGAILDRFRLGATSSEQVVSDLRPHGFSAPDIADTVRELFQLRAIRDEEGFDNVVQEPPADFPLQTYALLRSRIGRRPD